MSASRFPVATLLLMVALTGALAADWPQWGRDATRNAVSPEKGAPVDFQLPYDDGKLVKPARGVAWKADLGSRTLGTPTVVDGLVWIGTNAREPAGNVPAKQWDGGVLMCFRESDGKPLWKHRSPRLTANHFEDFPDAALGAAPLVEGDRLWYVNNRCEVVCFDIAPLKKGTGEPREVWKLDMRKELGVFQHIPLMQGGGGTAVAAYKDRLYVVTHNGVDEGHFKVPAPDAPSLVCLERATGKVLWKDNSPGKGILQCQISSPLVCEVGGRAQVIVAQGDGWLRSFDPATGKVLWKCDLNPKDSVYEVGNGGTRTFVVATPILYDGRVYVTMGLDAAYTDGVGTLCCIDPSKDGDVSRELEAAPKQGRPNPNSAVIWYTPPTVPDDAPRVIVKRKNKDYDKLRDYRDYYFGRCLASVTAHDGLVYAADMMGYVYCFDAKTGRLYWFEDLKASVWGQPLWADGKVYFGTDNAAVVVFAHGKEKKQLAKVATDHTIRAGLVFANGTLYVPTETTLYAVRTPK